MITVHEFVAQRDTLSGWASECSNVYVVYHIDPIERSITYELTLLGQMLY